MSEPIAPVSSRPPLGRWVLRVPVQILSAGIRAYQKVVSPVLRVAMGPYCGCRFHPTCSHYALQAVQTHGALKGSVLALWRILRCQPLHPGGFDPVPPRRTPVCRTSASSAALTASLDLNG